MYLASVLAYTIMLIGKEASDDFLLLHQKTSPTIFQTHSKADAHILIFLNDPRHCTLHSLQLQPLAIQSLQQCQDKTQQWTQQVPMGAVTAFSLFK
jgi:hypothetical protein